LTQAVDLAGAPSAAPARWTPDLVALVATTVVAAALRFAFLDQQSWSRYATAVS
jgi:hypothetical protein